jgi:cephalosporin hydroxylase
MAEVCRRDRIGGGHYTRHFAFAFPLHQEFTMDGKPLTDKHQTGLAQVYSELLTEIRERPVSLLEIGVDRGGSLFFWAEFFPHPGTRILGLDLNLPECPFPPHVQAAVCDQNDSQALSRLAALHGPFDIVIDDGSHFTKETRTCFRTLFPSFLKVGGWYIIEDWAVGYWKDQDVRYRGMVEVVTEIVAQVPELSISEFRLSLKTGQAYAAFRRGETGWRC